MLSLVIDGGVTLVKLPSGDSLRWRHNERGVVSNHRRLDCLLNRLLRRRSKKTLKLRVAGLCERNSPVTCEFPAQRASNAENVSIWWRHHVVTGPQWWQFEIGPSNDLVHWGNVNSLRPIRNRRHFADEIFKCIFLNENVWIALKISLEFVPKVRINNIPALVQIMAWRRPGDKPLSEPMMVHSASSVSPFVATKQLMWLLEHEIYPKTFSSKKVVCLIKFTLNFVPKGWIDDKSTLVQIMAWCQQVVLILNFAIQYTFHS